MLVKACLNGGRRRENHPSVPISPAELANDARQVAAAGAGAVHVHPRLPDGKESLEPAICDEVVAAIRESGTNLPIGLTTGVWIEPSLESRLALISAWRVLPDFASVNVSEHGAVEVAELLLARGVGVEAGLFTTADAEAFVRSAIADRCLRVLVEVFDQDPNVAIATWLAIEQVLDQWGVAAPRLIHGFGAPTWRVIEAALARNRDVRVGLEDTFFLPDGKLARDNAELVEVAVHLARGQAWFRRT